MHQLLAGLTLCVMNLPLPHGMQPQGNAKNGQPIGQTETKAVLYDLILGNDHNTYGRRIEQIVRLEKDARARLLDELLLLMKSDHAFVRCKASRAMIDALEPLNPKTTTPEGVVRTTAYALFRKRPVFQKEVPFYDNFFLSLNVFGHREDLSFSSKENDFDQQNKLIDTWWSEMKKRKEYFP